MNTGMRSIIVDETIRTVFRVFESQNSRAAERWLVEEARQTQPLNCRTQSRRQSEYILENPKKKTASALSSFWAGASKLKLFHHNQRMSLSRKIYTIQAVVLYLLANQANHGYNGSVILPAPNATKQKPHCNVS
jgi:hypothetical protein